MVAPEDITGRKESEAKIERLTRVQAVQSRINAAIVRLRDRRQLLNEACRIAVEAGRFPLAWAGVVDRSRGCVTPVAWNEAGERLLSAARHRMYVCDPAANPP